eukprot:CAMPEP_0197502766 /NCGR_PEP_ID=MMETSP1312-20131121/1997_1 /TAXON_ID=464262 /ORGANISM="Genus nov. species nov., Strain RCC2335" /LENGTH=783 /DNA_ID=CAMNT_0043049207 /DNA_START=71 /DNA_END=2422 /DNA_ORIENTATION=-
MSRRSSSRTAVPPRSSSSSRSQVQGTNDEANLSKRSARDLGYFEDWAIQCFVKKPARRAPLVNRGYFCRVHVLRKALSDVTKDLQDFQVVSLGLWRRSDALPELALLQPLLLREWPHPWTPSFSDYASSGPSISPLGPHHHPLHLQGCGFDTTVFQMISTRELEAKDVTFCEVDYPALVRKKAEIIAGDCELADALERGGFSTRVECGADGDGGAKRRPATPHRRDHVLLGQDLSRVGELGEALIRRCCLDPSLPTIFLSECVLNYVDPAASARLLRWIPSNFDKAVLLLCDYLRPADGFGTTMMRTLGQRGSPLLSVHQFPTCEEIEKRYAEYGWVYCASLTMADAYYLHLGGQRVCDVESKELFDEHEDWHAMCSHYTFTWAASGDDMALLAGRALPRCRIALSNGPAPGLLGTGVAGGARLELAVAAHGGDALGSEAGRWGQGACISGGDLFIFGGFGRGLTGGHQRLNDAAALEWAALGVGGDLGQPTRLFAPESLGKDRKKALRRMFHAVAPADGGFVVFGGRAGPAAGYSDAILFRQDGGVLASQGLSCEGEAPSPRWRHTLTRLGGHGDLYLVAGGWNGSESLPDLKVLERCRPVGGGEAWAWRQVRGSLPCGGVFGHTADLVREAEDSWTVALLGGCRRAGELAGDLVMIELRRLPGDGGAEFSAEFCIVGGPSPAPRYSHASLVAAGTLVVVGGVLPTGEEDRNAYAFDLGSGCWSAVRVRGFPEDHVWCRQHLVAGGSDASSRVALVGGGILCFSFGCKMNPLITVCTLRGGE